MTPPDGWLPGFPLVFDASGPLLNDPTELQELHGVPVDAGAVSDDDDDVPLLLAGARADKPKTKSGARRILTTNAKTFGSGTMTLCPLALGGVSTSLSAR